MVGKTVIPRTRIIISADESEIQVLHYGSERERNRFIHDIMVYKCCAYIPTQETEFKGNCTIFRSCQKPKGNQQYDENGYTIFPTADIDITTDCEKASIANFANTIIRLARNSSKNYPMQIINKSEKRHMVVTRTVLQELILDGEKIENLAWQDNLTV